MMKLKKRMRCNQMDIMENTKQKIQSKGRTNIIY